MNKDNFERLYRAIVEAQRLDMSRWADDCGTPACVLGHYAARIDLQSEFRIVVSDEQGAYIVDSRGKHIWHSCPSVREHFDISRVQAYHLFDLEGCDDADTPAEAAAYIRRFIDTKGRA